MEAKTSTSWHVHARIGSAGTYHVNIFFAIFRWIPEWDWDALPLEYRNGAYVSTDNSAIDEYLTKQEILDNHDLQACPDIPHDPSDMHTPSSDDENNGCSAEQVVASKDVLPTKRVRKILLWV